ncbi:ABC transporter substrate-binding protein [Pokkaliibacter sp. CJK22405]|uniref:ABC transporter substrate-binding protein n=1 Tax=Pokkaliibacter sp. CJK22405 TaxID=3384615 RepID=UPI003984DA8C
MKPRYAISCLAIALAGLTQQSQAAECGSVSIANMNWQSAEVLANVDKLILEKGYGCEVELLVGDTVPTITSMEEKGKPDIAPEGWVDLIPEVMNRGVKEGKLIVTSKAISDGGKSGWWVPKYIVDAHPEIKTIPDLLKHPELFPAPENPSKGGIVNGPQGWGGTVVTSQLFKAYGAADKGWVLVDPGSAAGLDGSMAKAYERKEGWVGYYWAPTALLGKYDMVKLDHGVPVDMAEWKRCTSKADCPDPKPNAWPVDNVETVVTKEFADRAGVTMDYLKARSWSSDTVNKLLAWMGDNQATGEEGAEYFLEHNEDLWTKWVPADVATKIKDSL